MKRRIVNIHEDDNYQADLEFFEEENKVIALKEAIISGINSGIAYNFNPESHLANMKEKSIKERTTNTLESREILTT